MQARQPDTFDMIVYYLMRFISFCMVHWVVIVCAIAGLVVADRLSRAGLPDVVCWLVAGVLVAAGIFFERKFLLPVSDSTAENPAGASTAPDAEQNQSAGKRLSGADCYAKKAPDTTAFDRVIGLEKAKEAVKDALWAALNKPGQFRKYGVRPPKGLLLYGPPGTGKTSFARAAAEYFGCSFYVVNASSVISGFVGQTEQNIRSLFNHARANRPAVIFFDEIDAIGQKRTGQSINSPSDLALNTLLAQLDGFSGSDGVFVIAATNRPDTLDEALTRPGRFDLKIEIGLPDEEARGRMFELYVKSRPNELSYDDIKYLARTTEGMSPAGIRAASDRAALFAAKEDVYITRQHVQEALKDISGRGAQVNARPVNEVLAELDALVGLYSVKAFMREVEAVAKANISRREKGLPALKQSMHMCFLGNPGTGKTSIARLAGELLAAVGALPSGHLVETGRSGLVAQYVGQTAQKTKEVIDKAMGGVLFVDEAYSLARGGPHDFGAEALDALVKAMDDYRDKMVVILAGYTSEMQALFAMNPGLESRIAFTCEFPDYSPDELLQIARMEAQKQGFTLMTEAESVLLEHFQQTGTGSQGNGRYARKVIEAAVRKAILTGRDGEIRPEDLA